LTTGLITTSSGSGRFVVHQAFKTSIIQYQNTFGTITWKRQTAH
jgi:hypothetical protein